MLTDPRLVLYLVRAANRPAITAGAVVALALVWVPAAAGAGLGLTEAVTVLRVATVAMVLGLAFVLDDPAAATTATLPTSRHILAAVRIAAAAVFASVVWAAVWLGCRFALAPESRAFLPSGRPVLEGLALLAVALVLAAAGRGGLFAAPALVLLLIAVALVSG